MRRSAQQYRKGLMGRDSAGMNWKMDQNVNVQTSGAWSAASASTLTADTTSANLGSISTGWQATSTLVLTFGATVTLKKGDIIQIANVFPVNPQNRQVYGNRRALVRRAVGLQRHGFFDGQPDGRSGHHHRRPVPEREHHAATSATATVTPFSIGVSATGVNSPRNILFHKNAYTCAMVDLELPAGVVFAGRASSKEAGISIRVVRQYTINNDQIPARFDVCSAGRRSTKSLAARSPPNLFNHGAWNGIWYGEDYAFSRRWLEKCGDIWIVPNLKLNHHSAIRSTPEFPRVPFEAAGRQQVRKPGSSEARAGRVTKEKKNGCPSGSRNSKNPRGR
jgi:hypothetical protein